ncbi:MAG: hypothetical protein H3C43_03185 [Leptonema sp. (in: Bacteria)]|nr:hypothetical protein [Leptonema sp. (in: bacteria)]
MSRFATIGAVFLFSLTSVFSQNRNNYFFSKQAAQDDQQVLETTFPESSSISEEDQDNWPEKDVSPNFPELQVFDQLDPEKSMDGVKQARLYYLEAVKQLQAGDNEALALEKQINDKPFQYEWQRREREQNLLSHQRAIQLRSRQKAIGFTIKALQTLDEVKNPGILASNYYVDLKSKTIRQYIRLHLSTGNISGVIQLIQEYFDLKKDHKDESEPYRVLAIVYRKLEIMAQERKAEKEFNSFKRLKNENLLKFTELAYGKNSNEYDRIQDQIRKDIMDRLP